MAGTPLPPSFIGRPQRPLASSITTVLFAGRLAPEKGLESVIDAALRLPWLRFMIAGDGPMRAYLEDRARSLPNVRMLGWLPRAHLLDLLDTIDLLVLPSRVESFGSIALEALARGRNVLVSRNCGIAEWPMFDRALIQIENGEDLAQAIYRLVNCNRALRDNKAKLSPQTAIQMSEKAISGWLSTHTNHVAFSHV